MSMPEPPWGPTRRTRERTPLSTQRIVDTALELVAKEGYDAVTMRRIARALDTGPSSLYAHVANKQQLGQMMIDRIVEGVELPDPDPDHWQEQVKQLGREFLGVMRAHPGVAGAAIGNVPLGPNAIRASEAMLGCLRAGGLPDRVVAFAADLLPLYITAVAFEESIREGGHGDSTDSGELVARLRDYFAALPADRFPNFVALAPALTGGDDDERFEFGLDVLLAGLTAVASHEDRHADP